MVGLPGCAAGAPGEFVWALPTVDPAPNCGAGAALDGDAAEAPATAPPDGARTMAVPGVPALAVPSTTWGGSPAMRAPIKVRRSSRLRLWFMASSSAEAVSQTL